MGRVLIAMQQQWPRKRNVMDEIMGHGIGEGETYKRHNILCDLTVMWTTKGWISSQTTVSLLSFFRAEIEQRHFQTLMQ